MPSWICKPLVELSALTLYDIMHLRCDVFVVQQNVAYLDPDNVDKLPSCHHLIALNDDGSVMAYARLLGPGTKGEKQERPMVGRVVTAPSHRGKGLGKELMLQAIAACGRLWPDASVEISAQVYLEGFYKALGFETTSAPYEEYGRDHLDMVYRR
ncbi:N-acetyltransferase GCN5 [Achlya hypogyna]|uniref:N-acetyltransferase GCN5 n=1 Tax=Achlya hypogyna TaxID=1202772 RepID=A0A1V9YWH5_ACHHY|nr:N-acetyltransferase GCN5 [Achlya hypogyna]